MKKIVNTALIIAGFATTTLTLNSCNDALDITQAGQLEGEDLYTNVTNLNNVLLGNIYGNMDPLEEIYFSGVFTDELMISQIGSGGQEWELYRHFLNPSSSLVNGGGMSNLSTSGLWLKHYSIINNVNRLLEGAAKITPNTPAEQTQYNQILAQARAARAFSYIQLEAFFSTDMKNPNALGVILLKDVPAVDAKLPRSTNQEVYDFINADLDYARNILPLNTTDRYRISKLFVNALTARFNLYRGNIPLAKQYAQEVINTSNLTLPASQPNTGTNPYSSVASGAYSTTATFQSTAWNNAFYGGSTAGTGNGLNGSFNPYRAMWGDRERGDVIFALNRLVLGSGGSVGSLWAANGSVVTGSPMWLWGKNLVNLFFVNGDVRKYAYVDPTSNQYINAGYDYYVIDKYPGKASTTSRNDLKLFRLPEMKFILAECEVAQNNLSAAQALIQEVRASRRLHGTATTPTYATAQQAYADILKERRIELALEGHRYLDLKRLATLAGVTMDRNADDDYVPVENLPNNSYKYTMPIPLSEISANPNIQQNPGY
ncbi:RagB/SusD family nutrient uptake outer membrane protein [Chryseobacterium indoltheticum]|uniref:RagB/SusD family nutrient uptake outer membrane protein n=1 Tax=Chryseobacterium indoltheticum TaxID=254 RepID=UPI001911745E|nr:RagB/SusD family nutrient uptake outer membrane protein [Chryseobacterium indoltheticum]QQQ26782.1 RagB/SusD family nutrient uptake outer membrane protein [Chryseobacterium indoltheticum]